MDKKVSTLTFQESHNFGALLQTYALAKKLEMLGCQAEIINYHSRAKEAFYGGGYNKKNSLAVNLNQKLSFALRKRRKKVMDAFRRDYLKLTDRVYVEQSDLKSYAEGRDYIVCGSDQIWNVNNINYDTAYFLDFVEDPAKKVAYAPSFGISDISGDRDFYQKNLQGFEKLSVREKAGAEIVRDLTGRDVPVVLDPCMLLEAKDWNTIEKEPDIKEPYIFVYYIKYSRKLIEYAKKISKQTGYKVVFSARTIRDYKDGFKNINIDVPQFIGTIKRAEYVITNSFHGTVFSILYGKKFVVFSDTRKSHNTNSRMRDLLEGLELENRFYRDGEDVLLESWDCESVNKLLDRKRRASEQYLKDALDIK